MRPLVIATLALLASVAQAAESKPFGKAERAAAAARAVAAGRDALDKQLFDYTTARFRDTRASVTTGLNGVRLCGFMNAKNRAGAYTGWKPFAILGPDGDLVTDDIMLSILCGKGEEGRTYDVRDYSADLTFKP